MLLQIEFVFKRFLQMDLDPSSFQAIGVMWLNILFHQNQMEWELIVISSSMELLLLLKDLWLVPSQASSSGQVQIILQFIDILFNQMYRKNMNFIYLFIYFIIIILLLSIYLFYYYLFIYFIIIIYLFYYYSLKNTIVWNLNKRMLLLDRKLFTL